jgi:hypothetical protein
VNTSDWQRSLPAPRTRRAAAPVIAPRVRARIRLLERRLQETVPQELTEDELAAIEELLETVRALAQPQPSGPTDPTPGRRKRASGDSLAA